LQPSDILTVLALIRKEVGAVYVPADGARGDDGKDGNDGSNGTNGNDGRDGVDGIAGRDGVDGRDGKDGSNGRDGRDGVDGTNGRDGKDGLTPPPAVSVREAWVDPDDGDLYIELTNSRLINAGHVKGKDGKPGKDGRSGVMIGGGGSSGGSSTPAPETFETVSKNLSASGAVMGYSGGDLVSVTYANGIVKTLAYSIDGLASVTLSGNTPSGIALVKTFNYSSGSLSGFTYS
jgi:Collagen triple helix repeat (20 copies)